MELMNEGHVWNIEKLCSLSRTGSIVGQMYFRINSLNCLIELGWVSSLSRKLEAGFDCKIIDCPLYNYSNYLWSAR